MSTDSATAAGDADDDPVADLEAAAAAIETGEERVAEFGEAKLERLSDRLSEFERILDRYEETATGDGDFQKFIEFQSQVADFVERLSEDLLLRETFEEADDRFQKRRLKESDFERVRADLEPVADLAGRLDERREAYEHYRAARAHVRDRRATVRERIEELERLQRLGAADLDAPVEHLRDPIETYNAAVRESFDDFKRETPAREVLAFMASLDSFPLVSFDAPPETLREYVETAEAGTEPIPRLLDFAEYSRSKLDHYVASPGDLKTAVRPNTTYLRRLDGGPLTVDWPPPAADELRWRCRELTSAVNRFDADLVAELRPVQALAGRADYDRLRDAAIAREELSADERERLQSGEVDAELERRRAELSRLTEALSEYPDR